MFLQNLDVFFKAHECIIENSLYYLYTISSWNSIKAGLPLDVTGCFVIFILQYNAEID